MMAIVIKKRGEREREIEREREEGSMAKMSVQFAFYTGRADDDDAHDDDSPPSALSVADVPSDL